MKMDDDIRGNPLTGKQHVLHVMITNNQSGSHDTVTPPVGKLSCMCPFAMSTGKLVANFEEYKWNGHKSCKLVTFLAHREHHCIHNSCFTGLHESTRITFGVLPWSTLQLYHHNHHGNMRVSKDTVTSSSLFSMVTVLPMITLPPLTLTPGAMIPSSSNLS